MVKDFSGEYFGEAGFKLDSSFVAQEKSLFSSLVDRRVIDLSSFSFKIYSFFKKISTQFDSFLRF